MNFESYLNDPHGATAYPMLDALDDLIQSKQVSVTSDSVTAQLYRNDDYLFVHLINNDLAESGFIPKTNFTISVVLPRGMKLLEPNAEFLSPNISGGEHIVLPLTSTNGFVQTTIPDLDIYGIVTIPVSD